MNKENSNDLISREALKKAIIEHRYDYVEDNFFWTKLFEIIDNAEAVDIKDQIAGAYNEGYMCGNKEAEKGRPQGEWIENNYGKIQCSICKGFAISTMTGCLMDRHLEQYKTKFCPNCGADMRKGGAKMES